MNRKQRRAVRFQECSLAFDAMKAAVLAEAYGTAADIARRAGIDGVCHLCANPVGLSSSILEYQGLTLRACGPCETTRIPYATYDCERGALITDGPILTLDQAERNAQKRAQYLADWKARRRPVTGR